MNKNAKIFLATVTVIVIGLGFGVYKYNNSSNTNNSKKKENQKLTENIYKNVEFTTETKEVRFETAQEMSEYAQKINTIQGIEESSYFLESFYNDVSTTNLSNLIPYYFPDSRQGVINNKAFPFYDSTNLFKCDISDLNIVEEDKNNNYTVTYKMTIYKKEDNSLAATIERKDSLHLTKYNEKIYIVYYSSQNLSSIKN